MVAVSLQSQQPTGCLVSDLADLQQQLRLFAQERDWEQFHGAKNLSMAIACEAGAEFADKHGMDFGRLIIAWRKKNVWQFADVNDKATREKARVMQASSDLESLFA